MAKAPAFQFYPKDFLGHEKQAVMTLSQAGAYVRLMCHEWNGRSIPDDAELCARLAGADVRRFASDWPAVRACFVAHPTESGRLIHPRLQEERDKQEDFRAQRAKAGKASAAQREANEKPTRVALKSNENPSLLSSSSSAVFVKERTA